MSLPTPTWSVALQRAEVTIESELAEAVAGALLDLGCSVRRVRDGEPAGVEADVLLLLVNLANFPAYARMLSRRRSQRPRTIVWQPANPSMTPSLTSLDEIISPRR